MGSQTVTNPGVGNYPVRVIRIGTGPEVQTITSGFELPYYDYMTTTYPTATTEQYIFRTGGAAGAIVGTVNLTYSDSTKANITIAEKV